MPIKIGFQVITCSGEDEGFSAFQLNRHGPTVRGWRSSVNCTYPQEIKIELKSLTILNQIQILVHQYLIPQKIEICTSMELDTEIPPENSTDSFEYLGFITFSDNKATGYRSRELKSILVPYRQAKFIKLIIHENFPNVKNIYNQVGIMGINILGDEVHSDVTGYSEIEVNNNMFFSINSLSSIPRNFNYISPYDDLAFEMCVDEEIVRIIKFLEFKKVQAINNEHYEYANTLKITLKNLKAAGEIIGLYEQEKKRAVLYEDYDKAKFKKSQIDTLREKIYSALDVEQLLESSNCTSDNSDENGTENKLFNEADVKRSIKSDWNWLKPYLDEEHNKKMFQSLPEFHEDNNNLNYKEAFFQNQSNPSLNDTTEMNVRGNSLVHSKSQTTFNHKQVSVSPAFANKQTICSSTSNPQLYHYGRQQSNEEDAKGNLSAEFQYDGTPTTLSSPSSLEDTGVLTTTDVFNPSEKKHSLSQSFSFENEKINENQKEFEEHDQINKSTTQPSDSFAGRSKTNLPFREPIKAANKFGPTNIIKNSFQAYEERMLPALRNYHGNDIVRECQLVIDQQPKTTLNERERKQAALPISVFGIAMIEKFFSRSFTDKEEGLKLLQEELKRMTELNKDKNVSFNKIARATVFLLHRALRDKVYSVYSTSAETIRLFFTTFVPERVSPSEIARGIEKLLPELLAKSGDVTPRIHTLAAHTLLSIAECEEVRRLNIIPSQLSRPLTSSVHPRLALSRLEMVEQLILNHGISKDKKSGLTCRTLAEFGSSGLQHPAESVRKVSERILILVYKVNPKMVRKHLPPDDNVTRRNLLYRQLFQEFDFMDIQSKLNDQFTEEDNLKNNKTVQSYTNDHQNFSLENVGFSINNNNDDMKNKSPNFETQLKTIKNFMSLNLQEKNKNQQSVHNDTLKNNGKILTKFSTDIPHTKLQNGPSVKKDSIVITYIKKSPEKNLKFSISGIKGNSKDNNKSQTVKFPSLQDSIDTTKAKLLFAQKKNMRPTTSESKIPKEEIQQSHIKSVKSNDLTIKKEIKRHTKISNIPVPITGTSRKYSSHLHKKTKNFKDLTVPLFYKKFYGDNHNSQIIKPLQIYLESGLDQKKEFEMTILKKKLLPTTHKNNSKTAEAITYSFERNFGKFNCKNHRQNHFSENILTSIKENESPQDGMSDVCE